MFRSRTLGPEPQHSLVPLLLGDNIHIMLLEKHRPLGLTPFILPLTITGEPALVLKLDLKQLGPEISVFATVTVMSSYTHSTLYDIMRYLKHSQAFWEATHGNPCFPKPSNNPWGEKQSAFFLWSLEIMWPSTPTYEMPVPSTLNIIPLAIFALPSQEHT